MSQHRDSANSARRPAIPEITINVSTTNLNSNHSSPTLQDTSRLATPVSPPSLVLSSDDEFEQGSSQHAYSPSQTKTDPNLLSPTSVTHILRSPSSPTGSESGSVPPSPTLSSHSSVHFQQPTSVDLRKNQPGSGLSSLELLSPSVARGHSRRLSNSSYDGSTEGTESDHVPLTPIGSSRGDTSSIRSPTATAIDRASIQTYDPKDVSPLSNSDKGKTGGDQGQNAPQHHEPTPLPDENIDPKPFAFQPWRLAALVDPKSLDSLEQLGGLDALIKGLGTDRRRGLSKHALDLAGDPEHLRLTKPDGSTSGDFDDSNSHSDAYAGSIADRRRVYGENILPARKSKTLLQLMWLAFKDKVLVLLSIAAVVSLALGFFQDFGTPPEKTPCDGNPTKMCDLPQVDWVEGVAIIVAIIIVVVVGSLNDWQKERQFRALNEKKEDRGVKVIRYGTEMIINVKDILVGDIALLEPGEVIPCDGIFLRGHNVRCDESGATGESDAIRKASYEECIAERDHSKLPSKKDCFILSGSKVLEGVGEYVVIAIGRKSFNGRIMMALRGDTENTPLQLKLNDLAELIAKLGSAAGIILFTALMIKFFVQLRTMPNRTSSQKAMSFVQILIISVTLIVVAVPEGLPLAVTLALAFATKRMTKANLLVRVLGSCETMANASVVCTDKTGTLTQNVMSVVAGSLGIHCKFVRELKENEARTNANERTETMGERKHAKDFSIEQSDLGKFTYPSLRKLFNEAITINSTAFEDKNPETGKMEFTGSKTETALLRMAQELGWEDYHAVRTSAEIVQIFPFSSERKAMGVVVKLADRKWRLYVKGASEILTKLCTRHVVVLTPSENPPAEDKDRLVETSPIGELERDNIARTIIFYANQTLRTIAICYRDLDRWPPSGSLSDEEVDWDILARNLTLIAITGIEDPLRPGVRNAVVSCRKAGVTVKMCTGDNVLTARSIALQCGIFTPGGIIMEGPVFRKLSTQEMRDIIPRLQVLARSSPEDKKILVEALKEQGETVGVTGDGTNDGPALKTANVGFSMGLAGTEVAKEASDIILMDDNFTSIVSAIMWGRCVNDAVRKFLQFQISVNIAAVLITFISAVSSSQEESVLTAVQLLWVNIIMDTFAALALATDPATPDLLNRKPDGKTAPLFSIAMRKQILGQALYQTAIILVFHFAGNRILGFHHENNAALQIKHDNILKTLVFNIFVFCQIFNSFNCRSITNEKNVLKGMSQNYYFLGITALEIGVQILIVFVGNAAFQVTEIGRKEWGISIALGVVSLPLGFLLRLIPDEPVQRLLIKLHLMNNPRAPVLPTAREDWHPAINLVRDNLETFGKIRGARMRSSSFVGKSRSARLQEAGIQLPSLLTMVPTLIASSVGAGWSPHPGSLSDPSNVDPSRSSSALMEGKIQIHPNTSPDDEIYKKWGPPSPHPCDDNV